MVAAYFDNGPVLPWSGGDEDERRFRRIVAVIAGITLVTALVLPLIPLPERQHQTQAIPPRLAKLVIEKQRPKPAPEPAPKPEPEKQAKPEPRPEPKPEPKPEAKPEPQAKPQPEQPKPSVVEQAREKASKSGVLAFSNDLADLQQRDVSDSLNKRQALSDKGAAASETQRDIVTSKVDTGSKGIDTANLSRDTGERQKLESRETTRVESPVESDHEQVAKRTRKQRAAGVRSDEAIQLVFDRHKSAFYRLYRRALRRNPSLQGTVVVRLTIAPSGRVTKARVISSELSDEGLERRIELRVMQLDFGAAQVRSTTVEYPIDFFPS